MDSVDQTMFADGFEEALVGVYTAGDLPRVVYNKAVMESIIMISNNLSKEEALEFLEHNVYNTYVGPGTPIYIHLLNYGQAINFITNKQ